MRTISTLVWMLGLGLSVTLWALPAHGYLSYTLSSELKKPSCTGDTDRDCLDNAMEGALAWIVAPHYFYDEDEDCSGWNNSYHYGRKDFFQVRPEGSGIQHWAPGDGKPKWVRITYFLLHPHDCQSHTIFDFGGHQGDSEHVRYWLYSYNLRTWYLFNGRYWHHGRVHDFSGAYLEARANEIGSHYASIAADEDGHGSWAGRYGSSSHCAGSEDDFCYSRCDCFVGTMRGAFLNGYWEWVSAARNIGGPPPYETWNASVVQVSGDHAYSIFDVGHDPSNREYWTYKYPYYQQFCGWECNSRKSDGTCNTSAHGETGCSSPLWDKVDKYAFSVTAALSTSLTEEVHSLLHTPTDPLAIPVAQQSPIVTQFLPSLTPQPPQEQLMLLKWLLTAPQGKIAVAFPDLLSMHDLSYDEREIRARRRTKFLIESLEEAGISAPDLPADFAAAAVVVAEPPPLEELPLGLLKDYNPNPDDPEALKLMERKP